MNSNGHFCANISVLGSASNGLAYSGFCLEICSTHVAQGSSFYGDTSFMGLFNGGPRRGSVKHENCIHTYCSLMSIENK